MNFLNTLTGWQWGLLLGVPLAIVALYFLRLRREPVEVPSTFLWRKSIEDLHVNSPWQRIRQSLLLYLQLLIVALVILALVRPGWQSNAMIGARSIVLIDNSASMSATDVLPSRLEEAKRQALAMLEAMHDGDVAMIVSFSDAAHVEQGFTGNRRELRQAVQAIRPTNRATDISEALKLAAGFGNAPRGNQTNEKAGEEASPIKLYILSDGKFAPVPNVSLTNTEPIFIPIGQSAAANIGITAFGIERSLQQADSLLAFGRIENFGNQAITTPVDLLLNGTPIDAAQVMVPANDSKGVSFSNIHAETGMLELRLGVADALAQDNRAWGAINASARPKVLLITPGNKALEEAVSTPRAQKMVDVTIAAPEILKTEQYKRAADRGDYRLIIYDRCRPDRMPQANTFLIDRTPPEEKPEGTWSLGNTVTAPQIVDSARNHPLMQWGDLGNVDIAEARPVTPPSGGLKLIDSNQGTLLAIAPREEFEDAVLGFAIYDINRQGQTYANTNWPIRRSFPTFVFALLEYLGGSHGEAMAEMVRPGQSVTLKLADAGAMLQVRTPSGKLVSVPQASSGSLRFADTEELGPYEVLEGSKVTERFAVNLLDPAESDIGVTEKSIQIGQISVAAQPELELERREIWKWAILAALAVLILEWYIYNRRVYF